MLAGTSNEHAGLCCHASSLQPGFLEPGKRAGKSAYMRTGGAERQEGCVGGRAALAQRVVQLQGRGRPAARQRSGQAELVALAGVQRGLAGAHIAYVGLPRMAQLESCRGFPGSVAVAVCSRLARLQGRHIVNVQCPVTLHIGKWWGEDTEGQFTSALPLLNLLCTRLSSWASSVSGMADGAGPGASALLWHCFWGLPLLLHFACARTSGCAAAVLLARLCCRAHSTSAARCLLHASAAAACPSACASTRVTRKTSRSLWSSTINLRRGEPQVDTHGIG
jgi:hypothetical protein